jgi:hypothetical protein
LELGKFHERVTEAEDDHAIEAEQLSRSIREISDALVNLNVLPIQDVPSQLRSVKNVLVAFSLVMLRLSDGALVRKPRAAPNAIPFPLFLCPTIPGHRELGFSCLDQERGASSVWGAYRRSS